MPERKTCDICNREIGLLNQNTLSFANTSLCLCGECMKNAIAMNSESSNKQKRAEKFFQDMISQQRPSQLGIEYINYLFGEFTEETPEDDISSASKTEESRRKPAEEQLQETALLYAGSFFVIVTIFLYFASNKEVSSYGSTMYVANIQGTIFTAASALASILCFIGHAIINAIYRKK